MSVQMTGDKTNTGLVVELGKYRRLVAGLSHAEAQNALLGIGEPSFQQTLSELQAGSGTDNTRNAGIPALPAGTGFFRAFAGAGTPLTSQPLSMANNSAISAFSPNQSAAADSKNTILNAAARTGDALTLIQGLPPVQQGAHMQLPDYPRPVGDNGRGMHWIPTTSSSKEVVDRFVSEAQAMKVKWMVILNDGTDSTKNDYLVTKLVEKGIMPVMRVFTPNGEPISGDLAGMVRHYKALGVDYFQLYNEPNNNGENPNGKPDVGQYLDKWIPAAKIVAANGGLPGFAALSPGGNVDDLEFLRSALEEIKRRGEVSVLGKAWVAIHNYTFNRPIDYTADSNGFLKFRWYDEIVREAIGRSLPIIGTEGGTQVGMQHDKNYPVVDEAGQARTLADAYRYMSNAEPYYFAYSNWVIANEAGGGMDPQFSDQALFRPDGATQAVELLKDLG